MGSRRLAFAGTLALLAAPLPAASSTFHVPSQYPTINDALDAAVAGDSVVVAPGVYGQYDTRLNHDGDPISSVAFVKAGVVLCSEAGPALTTLTIANAPQPHVVYRDSLAGPEFVLSGFSFTGTSSECLIYVALLAWQNGEGNARIEDCDFRGGNSACVSGGGGSGVNLTLRRCRFHDFDGQINAFGAGWASLLMEDCEFVDCGGPTVRLIEGTDLVVRRTRFVGNIGPDGGGACLVDSWSTVLFDGCAFEGNQSRYNYGGAALAALQIYGRSSVNTVRGCTFVGNYAQAPWGALAIGGMLNTIEENTFDRNECLGFSPSGSAVYIEEGDTRMERNVIAHSSGGAAVGKHLGVMRPWCNVFWQNQGGDAAGFNLDATDLVADPLFCHEATNDFTVNVASPCIPGHGNPTCTKPIGAWPAACGAVSVAPTTWGRIKAIYR